MLDEVALPRVKPWPPTHELCHEVYESRFLDMRSGSTVSFGEFLLVKNTISVPI